MREVLLAKFGEIYLKGLNRPFFMKMLMRRIRERVKDVCGEVYLSDSRIYMIDVKDMDECVRRVTRVFGVHSVSPAIEMEKDDFEKIKETASRMMDGVSGTFKVLARRSDKHYPIDSPEINAQLGERILMEHPQLKVDVKKPQNVLNVEIRDSALLYLKNIPAYGGMPVGTNGRATLLLSGGIDSPVAGWMIAKRGVKIDAVHFYSFPYTSERAKQKVIDLAKIISESCCGVRVHIVPFTDIQMQIHEKCMDEYTTILMRRYMMRIADRIAQKNGSQALITGESIGQVASQTIYALQTTNAVCSLPVFRPLIGFDKQEIIDIAVKIGTFETSSLPFEDCCTVFTPRHPATHPKLEKILECEEKLDSEALIQAAIDGVEVIET
ncbi:MAG: tRNA 4-thiouridine(8) synthase ThiI [Eubacteriales bacterium]|nr:tRNA 4-thiouridine(8) synthase ThiI [Eubacteriales bacterium]MDD3882227.1 tRNA 4-thiouridine(8) synthase ThiI [Eubacteriales bacterium]MDD4512576.1 tRNA 4-thiouridine(8) synthase ThiI [Eubacteriales bacterium]